MGLLLLKKILQGVIFVSLLLSPKELAPQGLRIFLQKRLI